MSYLFGSKLLKLIKTNNNAIKKKLFSTSSSSINLSQELSLNTKLVINGNEEQEMETISTVSSMTSLIDWKQIRERQENVIKLIDKCSYHRHKPSLVLISGSSRQTQADTKIPNIHFKQNSDFIYLTGLSSNQSSDCVLALIGGNGQPFRSVLFAPFLDVTQELWEGQDIREHSLHINSICDDFKDLSQLDHLIGLESSGRQVFVSKSGLINANNNGSLNDNNAGSDDSQRLNTQFNKLLNLNSIPVIHQISPFIDQLRVVKSKSECDAMRRVCRIGSKALSNTMSWTKSMSQNNLINESQISAKFEYESRILGARKLSFPSVCGSGQRSTIIHYGSNDKFCSANDWVLTDVGCEDYDGYNSDITRTWPISGDITTSSLHNQLYEALCRVQKDLISALSNSPMMTLDLLFRLMCTLLGKVLIEFKVLDITLSPQESAALAYRFCPHHVSHYLGLDIHDCPSMSRNIPLKPGMCFTIEPGLYFHKSHIIKPEFKGIGMRVEDDLLLNYDGEIEILTKECPK